MGLILQVGLSIGAYFRGWKWAGFIPLLVAAALGLLVAGTGASQEALGFLALTDLITIVVLIGMCIWVDPAVKTKNFPNRNKQGVVS